jgi:hypothetical protein
MMMVVMVMISMTIATLTLRALLPLGLLSGIFSKFGVQEPRVASLLGCLSGGDIGTLEPVQLTCSTLSGRVISHSGGHLWTRLCILPPDHCWFCLIIVHNHLWQFLLAVEEI